LESSLYKQWASGAHSSACADAAAGSGDAWQGGASLLTSWPGQAGTRTTLGSPVENAEVAAANTVTDGQPRDAWLRERFPNSRPPRREDAQSLWLWLEQELAAVPAAAAAVPAAAAAAAAEGEAEDAGLLRTQAVVSAAYGELCRQVGGGKARKAWCGATPAHCAFPLHAPTHGRCAQVSVGCVERGRLMAQCWDVVTGHLRAALAGRDAARARAAAAARDADAARAEAEGARGRARGEATTLRVLVERNAARVDQARGETTAWVQKAAQVGRCARRARARAGWERAPASRLPP
jgi:hypothetical protein